MKVHSIINNNAGEAGGCKANAVIHSIISSRSLHVPSSSSAEGGRNMGQFSMKICAPNGSNLSGKQHLIFLDETSTNTKMTRLRGCFGKGQRLKSNAPFGHWCTQTLIAGLRSNGLVEPFVVNAPMNRAIFDT
jgi:hypothetical protein